MQENKKDSKIWPAILLQGWKLQSHDQGVIKLSMTFINVTSLRFLSGIWPWKLVMPDLEKTDCLFTEKIHLSNATYCFVKQKSYILECQPTIIQSEKRIFR